MSCGEYWSAPALVAWPSCSVPWWLVAGLSGTAASVHWNIFCGLCHRVTGLSATDFDSAHRIWLENGLRDCGLLLALDCGKFSLYSSVIDPEKVGLRPLGWVPTNEVPDAAPISVMGNLRVLRDASRTRAFWALALNVFYLRLDDKRPHRRTLYSGNQ